MNASATLVFPATHADGVQFITAAKESSMNVVAATSEWDPRLAKEIGVLHTLPYIYDPLFPEQFLKIVNSENISRVFCPVVSVYIWLSKFIEKNELTLELIKGSPTEREMARHQQLMRKVQYYKSYINACSTGVNRLNEIEISAVFQAASNIYGESNEDKIAAMIGIFSSVPRGDVIEIGSLAGKSAAVLAILSRRFGIGNVLTVDSWQWAAGQQHDSPETVSTHMADSWDFDVLIKIFLSNLIPLGMGIFNYIHNESEKAIKIYKNNKLVESEVFGKTKYSGEIALIHIDGNHDYSKVKLDCDLWLPLLAPGGWLILDDYLWAHGDGPRLVGNELLEYHVDNIESAFVCGKALFVKFYS